MNVIRGGLVALACLATCGPALAAGFDVVAGPSVTSSERTTATMFASMCDERPDDNHAHFEPIGTLGWVNSRDTRSDDLKHEVFLAASSATARIWARRCCWRVCGGDGAI